MDEDDTGLKTLRRRAAISYIITALVVVATAADVIAESAYIYGWSDFWAWQIGDVYLVDQLFMSSAAVLLVCGAARAGLDHLAGGLLFRAADLLEQRIDDIANPELIIHDKYTSIGR